MIQEEEDCPCPECEPPVSRYRPSRPSAGGQTRRREAKDRLVYVCHPFAGDPAGNAERVRQICEELKGSCVPLAPQLLLPAYFDEATERDAALRHCLRLLAACDEVLVYGEPTEGIRLEIAEARRIGIPVTRAMKS